VALSEPGFQTDIHSSHTHNEMQTCVGHLHDLLVLFLENDTFFCWSGIVLRLFFATLLLEM